MELTLEVRLALTAIISLAVMCNCAQFATFLSYLPSLSYSGRRWKQCLKVATYLLGGALRLFANLTAAYLALNYLAAGGK